MARALILVALALAMTGCGAGDDGLVVQLSGDPEDVALWQQVTDAYEEDSGERVTINAVADRGDHLAKLTASYAAGRPPAAFLLNHRYVAGYARRGVIDPAGPRLGERRSGYYPVALDAFTYDGELQCVPQNAATAAVYYDADAFERAGVRVPGTLSELERAAARLSAPGRDAFGIEPSLIRAAPFVWDAGGELTDNPDAPTAFTLSQPEARRGLRNLLGLARFGPDATEVASKSLEERFVDGELAMLVSSRRDVPLFRTIDGFEWNVFALPLDANVLHSDGWCVSRGERAGDAWDFVEFATGEEGQAILARGGRTVPSLRSVARSPDYVEAGPPANNEVFLGQVEIARRLPTTAGWERVEESANLALEQAFRGRLTLDEAIARIERETAGKFE